MADVSQIKLPNGSVYDLIDEKSGYITAEYIENKTDYEIPVSRVGEIVVGETAIGTDSTNFPTSKAVVDYVDERVVQEMDAIDVGVTKVNGKTDNVTLSASDVGAITQSELYDELDSLYDDIQSHIPTSTSQLTNDSGFITSETDPTVPAWAKASTKPTYTANEVGALPSNTFIPQIFKVGYYSSTNTADRTYTEIDQAYERGDLVLLLYNGNIYQTTKASAGYVFTTITDFTSVDGQGNTIKTIKQLKLFTSNTWHSTSYQFPSKTSDLTNDSGYLTASDIASVMTYKGTKANYAALPSSGNTTGDVWHLTDTGAEWAWDGSAWQELGAAIDLSNYLMTSDIAAWAKASTKPTYTAAEVGALPDSTTIPSKVSDLTNDSGFITSYTDEKVKTTAAANNTTYYPIIGNMTSVAETKYYSDMFTYEQTSTASELLLGSTGKEGIIILYSSNKNAGNFIRLKPVNLTDSHTITLPDKAGTIALTSDIPTVPTKVSDLTNDSGFISSYTETDPVFSASAAAGITSTDISNWNAKVSDDHKWAAVTLGDGRKDDTNDLWIPAKTDNHNTSGTAYWIKTTQELPTSAAVEYVQIPRYKKINGSWYLQSTTPSANDNSTKVATTAYVDAAIPKVYSSTNTGGYLTMATLPIYDGTVE